MENNNSLGPANNYVWGKNHYDTLATVFSHLKTEINGRHGWNRPIEQLDGLTITFLGPNMVKINHAKYVVAAPHVMSKKELPEAKEFLDNLVKELAKKYKTVANTPITFKLQEEQQDTQLYSKLTADRSWALGGSYGTAVGRYMLTTSRIYSVKTKNLAADSQV